MRFYIDFVFWKWTLDIDLYFGSFHSKEIHILCSVIQSVYIIRVIHHILSFKDMHTSSWTLSSKTFMLSFPLLYSWHACLCSDVIIQNTYDLFSIHLVQNKHIVLSILSDSLIFQSSFFKLRELKTSEKFLLHSDLTNCTMSRRGVNS